MENINASKLVGIAHKTKAASELFMLSVKRRSGMVDVIPIKAPLEVAENIESKKVIVQGPIFSSINGNVINNYLMADTVEETELEENNEIMVNGLVCSQPYYVELKNGYLTQFILRLGNCGANYVSCLIWAKISLEMGDNITVCGRIQTRCFYQGKELKNIIEIWADNSEMVANMVANFHQ